LANSDETLRVDGVAVRGTERVVQQIRNSTGFYHSRVRGEGIMDGQRSLHNRASSKAAIAGRLRLIRSEVVGEDGGAELANQLGLPFRTWFNYETGVTIPGEVLLAFLEITAIEPLWLLHGTGPKYRETSTETLGRSIS
jgi:hypothetical protein